MKKIDREEAMKSMTVGGVAFLSTLTRLRILRRLVAGVAERHAKERRVVRGLGVLEWPNLSDKHRKEMKYLVVECLVRTKLCTDDAIGLSKTFADVEAARGRPRFAPEWARTAAVLEGVGLRRWSEMTRCERREETDLMRRWVREQDQDRIRGMAMMSRIFELIQPAPPPGKPATMEELFEQEVANPKARA